MNPAVMTSVFSLIIAFAMTFFGERVFKISLSATGFVVGGLLSYSLSLGFMYDIFFSLVTGVVGGVITAVLVQKAYHWGLFALGSVMAFCIFFYVATVNGTFPADPRSVTLVGPTAAINYLPVILAGFVVTIGAGFATLQFEALILRIITSLMGAIALSIYGYALSSGMSTIPQMDVILPQMQASVWGVVWLPLAAIGMGFQFFGAPRLFKH
jgi:hypothetical protein